MYTKSQIERKQKRIEVALKKLVHPENPLAFEMSRRYRELELMKC